jgi:hypothetical protein
MKKISQIVKSVGFKVNFRLVSGPHKVLHYGLDSILPRGSQLLAIFFMQLGGYAWADGMSLLAKNTAVADSMENKAPVR